MSGTSLDSYQDRYADRMHGVTTSEIRALFAVASRPEVISLAGGMPFIAALPKEEITDLTGRVVHDFAGSALQYGSGQGDVRLRERICEVMALEGVVSSPDDVVVTVGSQQGLSLLAQVFVDPGDVVLAEGPSYVGALGVFAAAQAEVVHVPMDDAGLIPSQLRAAVATLQRAGKRPKFLYTVPNFHNPAGVTLSQARRDEILAIAEEADLLIIEDNPYGLLFFEESPGPALRARDSERVIYLGSFSKTFAAGLRTGWVLAPHAIRQKLVLVNEAQVLCPSMFTQLIITEYLTHHPWLEQIKVFRELYRTRRDAMLDALTTSLPSNLSWTSPQGGFYVWVTLPSDVDSKTMLPRALAHKVAYVPGIGFYANGSGRSELRLSYCYPEPDRIREGVRRFAAALAEERDLRALLGNPSSRSSTVDGHSHHASRIAPGPELT